LPNFFGAVAGGAGVERQGHGEGRCRADGAGEDTLKAANIPYTGVLLEQTSVRVRFSDTDTQLKAKDTIEPRAQIPTRRIRPTWWRSTCFPPRRGG